MRQFHLKPKNLIFVGLFISFLLGLTLFNFTPAHAHEESISIHSTPQVEHIQATASLAEAENNATMSLSSYVYDVFGYVWDWAEYIGWHLNPWTTEPEPEKPEPMIGYGFAWSG